MWPALIFAANRNDRVIGRTKILIVSTKTKNGFNQSGAPPGKILAKNLVWELINEEIIKDNHKGIAIAIVKNKCLEILKIYGSNPVKFIIIIIKKALLIREENPFNWCPVVRETCRYIVFLGSDNKKESRDGVIHRKDEIIIKINKFIIQKIGEGRDV